MLFLYQPLIFQLFTQPHNTSPHHQSPLHITRASAPLISHPLQPPTRRSRPSSHRMRYLNLDKAQLRRPSRRRRIPERTAGRQGACKKLNAQRSPLSGNHTFVKRTSFISFSQPDRCTLILHTMSEPITEDPPVAAVAHHVDADAETVVEADALDGSPLEAVVTWGTGSAPSEPLVDTPTNVSSDAQGRKEGRYIDIEMCL